MNPLRRQAALTVAIVAAVLIAIFLAARMMYVSDRDALLFSVMVLAIGLVSLRIASLAERERAREAAEATRRQMIAAVSHDLRTPLASLRLLVEAVDDEIVDEETRRRYLATMRVNVNSLSTLIDDLFELSRIEAGDIEWSIRQVELGMLVDETVAAMQPEAGAKGVEIRTQLSQQELRAQADPEKVQRVLFNLIRNAIRHTPADGTVTVRATGGRGEIEIEIADTGDGIPAAERERVFDAFFRGGENASRGSDGAGLGLAVSRAIVERHGGRIWLAPATEGTSVRFSLPR
jgi:signal transduction histidine kinase